MPDQTFADLIQGQARPGQYYLTIWHAEEYQRRPYWHSWPPQVYVFDSVREAELMAADLAQSALYRDPIIVRA